MERMSEEKMTKRVYMLDVEWTEEKEKVEIKVKDPLKVWGVVYAWDRVNWNDVVYKV